MGWRGPRTPHVGRRSSERTEARSHEGREDARRLVGGWLGDGLARDRRPRSGSPALEGRVRRITDASCVLVAVVAPCCNPFRLPLQVTPEEPHPNETIAHAKQLSTTPVRNPAVAR